MEFNQKKRSNKISVKFGQERLHYTIENKDARHSFRTFYGNIEKDIGLFVERNRWFRNVGYVWFFIGTYQIIYKLVKSIPFSIPIWFLLGIVFLAIYYLTIIKFSMLDAKKGRVMILHDKNHDLIIDEIFKRRKEQLRDWHLEIDYSNDEESELHKYKILLEEEIITQEEYEELTLQVSTPPPMMSMN